MSSSTAPVALISGASSGIGRATALEFARHGFRLSLSGRNEEELAKVEKECRQLGAPDVVSTTGDLREDAVVRDLVEHTVQSLGQLDVLVNSLGVLVNGSVEEASVTDYDKVFDVNVRSPGVIVSKIHRRAGMDEAQYAAFLEKGKQTHALGRVGEADEVAKAIYFLGTEQSSFTTGHLLMVDGGRNLMTPR